MEKKSAMFVLSVGLAFCVSANLNASQGNGTLRIGVNHWPFWRIATDNVPSGADLEIWSEMAKRAGFDCHFEIMSHQGYLDGLAQGSIDGAVSLIKTAEREETMVFLEPPFRTKQKFAFYVRKGHGHRLKCYEDLYALKVGTAWRSTFHRLDQDKRIEKHYAANLKQQFGRLQEGRLDALALVEWQGDYYLRHVTDAGLFEKASYFQKEYHPIYLVMSKKSQRLGQRTQLEKALAGMLADGTVQDIADRYVPGWYETYEKPFAMVQLSASYDDPAILTRQLEWIRANQAKKNIGFVIHGGDMVRDGTDHEWRHADQSFRRLDGAIPYGIATGNHDVFPGKGVPRARNTAQFDRFFPLQRRQKNPFYAGHCRDGTENMVFEFQHGSTRLLLLILEFGVRDTALDWAREVLKQHSNWPTIVMTHAFTLGPDSGNNHSWRPQVLDPELSDRNEIWDRLAGNYPNIFLVLSGHYKGVRRESGPGDHGNLVHQVMAGFPQKDDIKHGWLRLMTFYPEQDKVLFETYSPVLDTCKRDAENQFEIECQLMTP